MKKILGGFMVYLLLPMYAGAFYSNTTFLTQDHAKPAWFIQEETTGSFYGALEDGTTFTQAPVTNSLGIRLHKFAIEDAFFYISDRGVIYADSDIVALSVYLTLA